ncbi:MAG: multiple monosaccharide ABC transporter permease [Mycoplasmatales bacterium]
MLENKLILKKYSMLIALLVVFLGFSFLTNGANLSANNISNIIMQYAYVLILAIGMLLVIVTGNIDLSVGSIVGFTGAISGILLVRNDVPILIAIPIVLLVGTLIGMSQGFMIAYVGVPAFIATLSGMMIYRGLTMVVLGGESLSPFPEKFNFIASGYIYPDIQIFGLNLLAFIAMIAAALLISFFAVKRFRSSSKEFRPRVSTLVIESVISLLCVEFILYNLASFKGITAPFVILLVLVCIYSFLMKNTIYGRQIYAVGGNYHAAEMSGIKNKKIVFWVYANMGMLAAVSGILVAARLNAATPSAGNMFELDAIAACFIGGASATGGKGTIIGAIIGALIMGTLNNGMSIMGVSVDWQEAIKGLVLLIAVIVDVRQNKKS